MGIVPHIYHLEIKDIVGLPVINIPLSSEQLFDITLAMDDCINEAGESFTSIPYNTLETLLYRFVYINEEDIEIHIARDKFGFVSPVLRLVFTDLSMRALIEFIDENVGFDQSMLERLPI